MKVAHDVPMLGQRASRSISVPVLKEESTPLPGRFTPNKGSQYPLYRRLGGSQGLDGNEEDKIP